MKKIMITSCLVALGKIAYGTQPDVLSIATVSQGHIVNPVGVLKDEIDALDLDIQNRKEYLKWIEDDFKRGYECVPNVLCTDDEKSIYKNILREQISKSYAFNVIKKESHAFLLATALTCDIHYIRPAFAGLLSAFLDQHEYMLNWNDGFRPFFPQDIVAEYKSGKENFSKLLSNDRIALSAKKKVLDLMTAFNWVLFPREEFGKMIQIPPTSSSEDSFEEIEKDGDE